MPVDLKRSHIRPDDVFTQIPIHLDDDRSGHPWTGHDQVVTFDSRLHAAEQPADIPKFLPSDPLQNRLSRRRLIRRDCDTNDEGITQEGICTAITALVIALRNMQWAEVRLLKCPLQSPSLDTALEPELDRFVNTTFGVLGTHAL